MSEPQRTRECRTPRASRARGGCRAKEASRTNGEVPGLQSEPCKSRVSKPWSENYETDEALPSPAERILEAIGLPAAELRLLVANYYQSQRMRKTMDLQLRHLGDKKEVLPLDWQPAKILTYAADAFTDIEEQIAKALKARVQRDPVGCWLMAQRGIGPVITAGLLAHIDITKAPTAGNIWSFAGLNPERKWKAGEKRPYNADLKQVCWHAGQCFMKQSNDPDCVYGRLYRQRKQYEIERNGAGANAERAKVFKVKDGATKAVKEKLLRGQLPDFNIDDRARRFAVKIFLSHLQAIMFWDHFKRPPPKPFAISILGHAHEIAIPHMSMFPGFEAAYYGDYNKDKALTDALREARI